MNLIANGSDLISDHNSNEILGLDRLEHLAQDLARTFSTAFTSKKVHLLPEVKSTSEKLLESYLFFTKVTPSKSVSPALEWFLDNFHIVEEQLRSIKRDLPKNFYDELPKISSGEFAGYPRVYAITYTYVMKTDCRLDIHTIASFIKAYQKETPLTIGEIWAIAITFRISLIQRLRPLVDKIHIAHKMTQEANLLADTLLELSSKEETRPSDLIHFLTNRLNQEKNLYRPMIVQLIQRLRDQDPNITKAFDKLEEVLQSFGTNSERVIQLEHYHEASNQVTIGNIISSMRLLSKVDWHDFFEEVSLVDPILATDPFDTYRKMDWASRDQYRKVLERISKGSSFTEIEVAQKVIEFAKKTVTSDTQESKKNHVGYFLVDRGVLDIERALKYRSPIREKLVRFVDEDPNFVYFGSLILSMIIFTSLILKIFPFFHDQTLYLAGLLLVVIIPVSEFSLSSLNYVISLLRPPKRLYRMETKNGLSEKDLTMVVVPCLFNSIQTVEDLVANLEVQYLANQDQHIYFSLLGDLTDAASETTESDHHILTHAHELIHNLNLRYAVENETRFFVFHRSRLYNASEGKWIAWERKRGKIMEFNRLIRGDENTTFLNRDLDYDFFKKIQYVITLDADTQLPLQSARRLVGTIIHPLNKPVYCPKQNRVIEGYGILQPRISVSIVSAARTRFARIFSGNVGIDPYTTAVSDIYQDLFNEGSFTGKGLYVVDAFEKVTGERVPENFVLSHDLLEGSFARVGLVTDLELIDDYPGSFEIFVKRLHRWTRGDWQIAMWILPFAKNSRGLWVRNRLPFVARWKILDNLRRSLLAPITLIWFVLAWTILPGSPALWTLIVVLTMSFPVYAPSLRDFFKLHEESWGEHCRRNTSEIRKRLEQTFFMLIFMPSISVNQIDAIIRSMYRLFISKKKLLEWVTFSQVQSQEKREFSVDQLLSSGIFFSVAVTFLIAAVKPEAILVAAPFLLTWALTPLASLWVKRRPNTARKALEEKEILKYRRYARMTWNFFEIFARESNNWLAPDNFQEDPLPTVAQRTSPTNIGLQFLSTLSAYDLGYIGIRDMVEFQENTLKSLGKLETMKGHFYNWYDTQTLTPLHPKYISTVDSGNLAGHLIALRQGILRLCEGPFSNLKGNSGFKDGIMILIERILIMKIHEPMPSVGSYQSLVESAQAINALADNFDWQKIKLELNELVASINKMKLEEETTKKTIDWIASLRLQVDSFLNDDVHPQDLIPRLQAIAHEAEQIYLAMDFNFLFDSERKIFVIGHNVTDSRRDDSYYDLLASESRLASFFAIAKGDVEEGHWFRLGRSITTVAGSQALVSWSATMFEYLMPLLVMRRYGETLIDQTYDAVVLRQIEYGFQRQIPWGISEAGYNARDLNFNYQYGPFGIPGLGLKRGLRDELVVSPYSTMLAAMVLPQEALSNLEHLESIGALGDYGFHESIDYTTERIPQGKKFVILKSYMAHHQGMSLISINNLVNRSIMQRRFHAEPRVKAVQLLLQEKIPAFTQLSKPRAEETHLESFARFSENHYSRIYTDPNLSTPRTHILSNGNYSVMMTTAGAGYSKCEERMVTRWKEDPTMDQWGQFIFVRNCANDKVWSTTHQPLGIKAKKYEVHYAEDKIEFIREDQDLSTHTEVIVSCEDNVELRRVTFINHSEEEVVLEVTSYMEVILAKPQDDAAHPAFSNLFVQTEYDAKSGSILANRRLRTKSELELWGLHMMVVDGKTEGEREYETDRNRFIGRGQTINTPAAMMKNTALSNSVGAVLDPIFSLRQKIRIRPHASVKVTYVTGMVFARNEALRLTEKYHDPEAFLRQVNLGWVRGQMQLRHLNITTEKAHVYQRLGGRILYLAPYLRAQSETLIANRKNQTALWAYGISGDLPIVLTQIQNEKDVEMIKELLRAHEYLRLKGLRMDLVILNEHGTSYLQNLQDELMRIILISGCHSLLDKPGGIFIRKADMIPYEDLILVKSVSRLILFANKGSLEDQLKRRPHERELPTKLIPTLLRKTYPQIALPRPEILFSNGMGGFSPDGKEYVITLKDQLVTPAPWINVISNKNDFGFIVSESGSGYTWSVNSRENRLSTWSNDAVSDPSSEAIYIQDEETGITWSPTPLPIRSKEPYLIRHGQGYSSFEHGEEGILSKLTLFVPPEDSVKIIRLTLKNSSDRIRKLSITNYIDWVLGFSRSQSAQTVVSYWDNDADAIFARNSYNNEFAQRVAFLTSNLPNRSFTCSRKEFIGRNGNMAKPAGLTRKRLSGKYGGGFDPCGAIQSLMELNVGEEKEIVFLIGQGASDEEARSLSIKYKDKTTLDHTFKEITHFWDKILTTIEVKTPDRSFDLLVNRWLPYQTLVCRIWARSAFYQSGGAFGYRDQLQDVMAMVYSHPEITRAQILLAASRQFPEGDVQHWWHPPTGRGVRTRFSDDLLWLPFVVNYYIQITNDVSVLNEVVPFIQTDILHEGHDETYTQPTVSFEKATIFEHCLRTINRSLKVGDHGLPLMGSGDWNDGMSRVGNLGKGESVWLAWFLIKILKEFSVHCDEETKAKYLTHVEKVKTAIETQAWDGEWYLRAYFDNGEKMGSRDNVECQIDAIAQSWSLLSGEGNPERSRMAIKAVDRQLIDRENKIIKLFTPPFDKSEQDPGYIKGYLPGVRENGGQYTHAAIWTMMAYAELKDGKAATELFSLINPINRSSDQSGALKYKVEPYVISADIYGVPPHVGRGGWSWYTGSASWMYRAGIESILGFKLQGETLTLNPCIPKEWDQFEISYAKGKATYIIKVLNNQDEASVEIDGKKLSDLKIPIIDDGKTHQVVVHFKN